MNLSYLNPLNFSYQVLALMLVFFVAPVVCTSEEPTRHEIFTAEQYLIRPDNKGFISYIEVHFRDQIINKSICKLHIPKANSDSKAYNFPGTAAYNENIEVLEFFLKKVKCEFDIEVVRSALEAKSFKTLSYLFNEGKVPSLSNNQSGALLSSFFSDKPNSRPLYEDSEEGRVYIDNFIQIIDLLFEHGFNPKSGFYPGEYPKKFIERAEERNLFPKVIQHLKVKLGLAEKEKSPVNHPGRPSTFTKPESRNTAGAPGSSKRGPSPTGQNLFYLSGTSSVKPASRPSPTSSSRPKPERGSSSKSGPGHRSHSSSPSSSSPNHSPSDSFTSSSSSSVGPSERRRDMETVGTRSALELLKDLIRENKSLETPDYILRNENLYDFYDGLLSRLNIAVKRLELRYLSGKSYDSLGSMLQFGLSLSNVLAPGAELLIEGAKMGMSQFSSQSQTRKHLDLNQALNSLNGDKSNILQNRQDAGMIRLAQAITFRYQYRIENLFKDPATEESTETQAQRMASKVSERIISMIQERKLRGIKDSKALIDRILFLLATTKKESSPLSRSTKFKTSLTSERGKLEKFKLDLFLTVPSMEVEVRQDSRTLRFYYRAPELREGDLNLYGHMRGTVEEAAHLGLEQVL